MKLAVKIALGLIALFIVAGYLLSDDIYYRNVVNIYDLKNSKDVFNWATKHYGNKPGIVHTNASPIHLMRKHKDLYCDEGAIVMATLDHKLGYKTRLIDLIGADSIAHHTVLQVYDRNQWFNADFITRDYDSTLALSANKLHVDLKGERIKPYPKSYNFFINNNYFLKRLAFKIRGIDESGN